MIVRLSATHSIYIAPPSSIGYSVCKALVVQRIEQIRPKDKIEVQFFARAQHEKKGTGLMHRLPLFFFDESDMVMKVFLPASSTKHTGGNQS